MKNLSELKAEVNEQETIKDLIFKEVLRNNDDYYQLFFNLNVIIHERDLVDRYEDIFEILYECL